MRTIRTITIAVAIIGAGALGFSAGSNAAPADGSHTIMLDTVVTTSVCATEDGSAPGQTFPCAWDAATHGNGVGISYVLNAPLGEEDPASVVGAN